MSIYCDLLGTFSCSPCVRSEAGGIDAVVIVTPGTPLPDPTDKQTWFDAICSGLAVPIQKTRGSLEVEAVTVPGYGRTPTQTISYNYTLSINLQYQCDNAEFFNQLNFRPNQYEVWYVGATKIYRAGNRVAFNIMSPISEDVNSLVETVAEITWSQQEGSPVCYDRPADIFDGCDAYAALEQCLTCNQVVVDLC